MHKVIVFCCVAISMLSLAATPTVTDVVAKQRFPWNGLVDIKCKVAGIEESKPHKFCVDAVMPDSGKTNKLSQFSVVQDGTKRNNFKVTANGDYHLVWDAKAELGSIRCTNMIVSVSVGEYYPKVQLWEDGPYWATTNIGADNPWDYGYYFWWGDTVGYKRENNKWVASNGSNSDFSFASGNTPTSGKSKSTLLSEGWIISGNVLAPEHDAANIHWGNGWRMPTMDELSALNKKCVWTWTTMNGVKGYVVRGRGGYANNSIFLPAAGCGYGTSRSSAGSEGFYWLSNMGSSSYYAWFLSFNDNPGDHGHGAGDNSRIYGRSVRPVLGFTK